MLSQERLILIEQEGFRGLNRGCPGGIDDLDLEVLSGLENPFVLPFVVRSLLPNALLELAFGPLAQMIVSERESPPPVGEYGLSVNRLRHLDRCVQLFEELRPLT